MVLCKRATLHASVVSRLLCAMSIAVSMLWLASSYDMGATKRSSGMTIYYWNYLGRAAAAIRMCDAAGVELTHVSDFETMLSVMSARGMSYEQTEQPIPSAHDVFAPPILSDGDGMLLGQSVAIQLYLGEKLGFDEGVPSTAKAVQHMADLNDFLGEVFGKYHDMRALREFNEASRFKAWMGNIERSILGPYYYGARLTYVDFYFLMVLDWVHKIVYDAIEYKAGDLFAPYTKVTALRARLHEQPWYALQLEALITIPKYSTTPELAATY